MSDTNRNHKDRVFNLIFGREENKSWTLSLYNAVNNSDFTGYSDAIVHAFRKFSAPFSGKTVHVFRSRCSC